METKFHRNYKLRVQKGYDTNDFLEIPLNSNYTLKFNITRNIQATANTGYFTVINLPSDIRNDLFKDRYEAITTTGGQKKDRIIIFEVGYGDNVYRIFQGELVESTSQRQGTEFITNIDCRDSAIGIYQSRINISYKEGITERALVNKIITSMKNIRIGDVSGLSDKKIERAGVLSGNAFDNLKKITKNNIFIDNGVLNILPSGQGLKRSVPNITSENLLTTPYRSGGQLIVDILFSPDIIVHDVVRVNSTISPAYNGVFIVNGLEHSGTISPVEDGVMKTTLYLQYSVLQTTQITSVNTQNTSNANNAYEIAKSFIKNAEQSRLKAYKDSAGVWTIGYGHTENVYEGQTITIQEQDNYLNNDLRTRFQTVWQQLSSICNDNQIASLTSFCFNVGQKAFLQSTLLKVIKVNPSNYTEIRIQFFSYVKATVNGKLVFIKGLQNRREAEYQLYIKPLL